MNDHKTHKAPSKASEGTVERHIPTLASYLSPDGLANATERLEREQQRRATAYARARGQQ